MEGHLGMNEGAYKKGIYGRGVYRIRRDSIDLQYYYAGESGPFLTRSSGEILNDTTFLITYIYDYKNGKKAVHFEYKFKEYPIKPDSLNYIRDNKRKFNRK